MDMVIMEKMDLKDVYIRIPLVHISMVLFFLKILSLQIDYYFSTK